jgi:hypothetical protein
MVRGQSIVVAETGRRSVPTTFAFVCLFVSCGIAIIAMGKPAVGCGGLDLAFFLCIDLARGIRRRGEATDQNSLAESDVE